MGYRSNFLLTAKPITEDLYQRISDELKQYVPYIMCECMEDGAGVWLNEDDTWYSCQSDMIQLSKDFPDTFFELSVEGENHNDDWRAYFSDGKYQVNDALRLFWPFIPNELREDHSDEDALDYAGCVRLEHLKVTRATIYHSLRILLAKDEKDFPWDEDLIQAAEAMSREFLTSKGFAVPAAEQPDGKQEKDGGNDDEREKT